MSRRQASRMAVAAIVVAGAVVLSGCTSAPDVASVDASSTTGSTETTSAPETTAAPTTAPPTTAVASADPASVAVDRLFGAFNAEDAEEVAEFFGDDIVYTLHDRNEQLVGADAAGFFQSYFGVETGERITDAFHASDGRAYFLGKFSFGSGASQTLVFDVEMDGGRLIGMGDRSQKFEEVIAAGQIDDLYAAFNDQDVDLLADEFEGTTYTSPSGEEFTGAVAAEHWADAFGFVITRTSGVFTIGDATYGFAAERTEPDSGRSSAYSVEIQRSGGRIISMIERRSQT